MLVGWSPLALAVELVPLPIRSLSVQLSATIVTGGESREVFAVSGMLSASVQSGSQRRMDSVEVSKLQSRTFANRADELAEALNE